MRRLSDESGKYMKTKVMRTAKLGNIIISVLLCAAGIMLIAFPRLSAQMIAAVCGILLIISGALRLIGYFSKDLYRLAFQYDLALGILTVAVGIIVLLHPSGTAKLISIALGISVLADGLFKIQISVDSRRFGLRRWWLILALALLTGAAGLLLIFYPSESSVILTILLGISLLAEGILNIGTMLIAVKIIGHQQPDVIESEDYSVL